MPKPTAKRLFGSPKHWKRYLELCRFFVVDSAPKNSPSKFLATTHRLIRKDAPHVWLLYTYAAGFGGMVGTVYQAAGYDYIGKHKTDSLILMPDGNLIHRVSLWHRYGKGRTTHRHIQDIHPGAKQWVGYNFAYVYWLDSEAKTKYGNRVKVYPHPTEKDIVVWTVDHHGAKQSVDIATAKATSLVTFTVRPSSKSKIPTNHVGDRGSIPTRTLYKRRRRQVYGIDIE